MKKIVHNRTVLISVFIGGMILLSQVIIYQFFVRASSVLITAQVNGTTVIPPNNPGGGGGGGSPGPTVMPTMVNFSGVAYPLSKIVILQDGVQVVTTVADPNANFAATLSGLNPGSYTFSVYTVDKNGNHSAGFSFPISITTGATVTIGGIILAPTIDVDKTEVKKGDNEIIFGFAAPNSKVNIAVHSATESLVSTTAGTTGAYLYNFDTTPLEYGNHDAQSRSILANNKVSPQTNPVAFLVSTRNKTKTTTCAALVGDLNCDNKVNLVDFSIMAYWYKKGSGFPAIVDLNTDGKINLVDFSILAYHWTG